MTGQEAYAREVFVNRTHPLPSPQRGRRLGRRVTTSRTYQSPYYPGPVLNMTIEPGKSPGYAWWPHWVTREFQVCAVEGRLRITHEWSRK